MKICKSCNENKELTEFYSQKFVKSNGEEIIRHQPKCKSCISKKYSENKEEIYKKKKEYRRRNPQESRENARRYRQRHLEKVSANQKRWRQENPEKIKEYRIHRESNKKHNISNEEWENCKNYFNYRCAYCGIAIEDHFIVFRGEIKLGDFHKEHVDHSGENDLSNCIPSCKSCNGEKNIYPFFDWYSSDNEKFDFNRFDKILKWLSEDYKSYIEQSLTS